MNKLSRNFEQLFVIFLILNPFLDIISGTQIYLLNGGSGMMGSYYLTVMPAIGISLAVRMLAAVLMAVYLFVRHDWRAVLAGTGIVAAFALTVLGEVLRGEPFALREDIMYIARFGFNVAALFVYAHVLSRTKSSKEIVRRRTDDIICWTLIVVSLGILLPYLAKIGFYTYADRMGCRGSRGLFYAGNDVAALMMLLLPLLLCALLRIERLKSLRGVAYLFGVSSSLTALLVLGTKTAFLTVGVIIGGVAIYSVGYALYRRSPVFLIRFVICILAFVVLFGFISVITRNEISQSIQTSSSVTGELAESEGVETAILSGRSEKLMAAWNDFKTALPLSAFIGIGRGSQQAVIEMDLFELFLYYGVLGAVALAWVYVKNGIQFLMDFFRHFSLTVWCGMLSLLLCCGYMFLAGHTLFSVTSGFYFAITLLYVRAFSTTENWPVRIL